MPESCEGLCARLALQLREQLTTVFSSSFPLFPRKSRHVIQETCTGPLAKAASSVFSWRSTHCRTSSGECRVVFSIATNCTFGSRS